jgi:hypothetical protein
MKPIKGSGVVMMRGLQKLQMNEMPCFEVPCLQELRTSFKKSSKAHLQADLMKQIILQGSPVIFWTSAAFLSPGMNCSIGSGLITAFVTVTSTSPDSFASHGLDLFQQLMIGNGLGRFGLCSRLLLCMMRPFGLDDLSFRASTAI